MRVIDVKRTSNSLTEAIYVFLSLTFGLWASQQCSLERLVGRRAMHSHEDDRNEAAIYWSAVSLIVCEGLPIDKAAERLGVEGDLLRDILHRRQVIKHYESPPPDKTSSLRH